MVNKLTILYVLEPFLFQPKEELHLSYLSKYFNEPHPTLRLKLNYLEEKGILKKTYKGRLTLYKINFNLPNIIDIITISEKIKLIKLSQENLIFREFINFLQTKFEEKNSIVIFGSFVENYKKANDIDILIIGKYNNKNIEDFIKKYNLNLHIINLKKLSEISNSLKIEIIKKHLLIKNSESLIRWLYW